VQAVASPVICGRGDSAGIWGKPPLGAPVGLGASTLSADEHDDVDMRIRRKSRGVHRWDGPWLGCGRDQRRTVHRCDGI